MNHYPPPAKSGEGITEGDKGLKRRDLLLGGTSLAAASSLPGSRAHPVRTGATRADGHTDRRQKAEHPLHHGRRHRLVQCQRLQHGRSWATARPTSTASPRKARSSPTGTASKVAPPGRAAFITGQSPIRTGLTKVGLPGARARTGPQIRVSPMS